MAVFMTHLEKNRPGFGIEMKRQGVLFETWSADFYIHPFHRPCGRGFVFTFIKKCVLVGGYSGMMELVETGGLRHFVLCSAHIAVIITFGYWDS